MNPVAEKRYLPEIQGLRTLAALLVAVYHIWFQQVSGGVDVFFVVAAFFMVLSLARHQSLQFSHIAHYFLNTLRRMLPVMAVVLVVTALGVMVFSPEVVWRGEIRSALASLFFYQNAYLARQGADYLNQGLEASAFQQMWALSLQMQMAIFLPLLVYGVARCTRHAPAFYRRALVLVLLGVGLVSLG